MTVTEQEITSYAEAVRRALGDLPAELRDELTEDLNEHLTEVAAEADGGLVDRLGPPEVYAAELRVAAGVRAAPVRPPNMDDKIADAVRQARVRLGRADVRFGPVIGYDRVSDFVRLLRPAWWVLRAFLLAWLLAMLTSSGPFTVIVLTAALTIGSVWLGRRERGFPLWPRIFVGAAGVTLVLYGLFAMSAVRSDNPIYYTSDPPPNPVENVQDVYVYDGTGRLVPGARLFDQNGEPIRLGSPYFCDEDGMVDEPVQFVYPFCPEMAPFGRDVPEPSSEPTAPPPPPPSPMPTTTPSPSVVPPSPSVVPSPS